jgi:excisionase family DNA binding protein
VNGIYDTFQIAEKLHVNPNTVRQLIRRGELKAFRVGWHYRITDDALNEFVKGAQNGTDNSRIQR